MRRPARDPYITPFFNAKNGEMRCLRIFVVVAQIYQIDQSEYLRRDINQMFGTEWEGDIFDGLDYREMIYCDYNHEMEPLSDTRGLPKNRIYVASFVLEFDGRDPILVTKTHFTRTTGAPASQTRRIMASDLFGR